MSLLGENCDGITPDTDRGIDRYRSIRGAIYSARTNHILHEDEVKAVLGIADNVATFALMPIGYPTGRHGPLTRKPVVEVTYADSWGTAWPAPGIRG